MPAFGYVGDFKTSGDPLRRLRHLDTQDVTHQIRDAHGRRIAPKTLHPVRRFPNAYRWRSVAVLVPIRVPAVNHPALAEAKLQRLRNVCNGQTTIDPP
jgi:hypothetical protein